MRRGEVAFISQMIRESQAFARQVKWFTSLVSRGDNLPPLYRLLTEVGAVKVVKKRWPRGKSRAALSPGLYGRRQTPSSILTLLGGRAVGARHRQLAAPDKVCTGARTPARSKCFFHLGVEGKTHRPLLQRQGGEATRSVKAVLLSPTSPANDGSPMISPRISSWAIRSSTAPSAPGWLYPASSWRSTS